MRYLSLATVVNLLGRLIPGMVALAARRLATHPKRPNARTLPPGADPVTFRFGLTGLRWGMQGPRVLALHGWEGRATQFRGLGERLAARGYQLIALDAPGHGRSPGTEAHPMVFAGALHEAAAELGPLHAVVGHSMGGAAALLAQTLGLRAARSVVIAAPASLEGVLSRMARAFGLPPRAAAAFISEMERYTGASTAAIDVERLEEFRRHPLLVVHDQGDRVIPFSDGVRIAATGQGELLATTGLGHRDVLKDNGVLERIALFLAPSTVQRGIHPA